MWGKGRFIHSSYLPPWMDGKLYISQDCLLSTYCIPSHQSGTNSCSQTLLNAWQVDVMPLSQGWVREVKREQKVLWSEGEWGEDDGISRITKDFVTRVAKFSLQLCYRCLVWSLSDLRQVTRTLDSVTKGPECLPYFEILTLKDSCKTGEYHFPSTWCQKDTESQKKLMPKPQWFKSVVPPTRFLPVYQ